MFGVIVVKAIVLNTLANLMRSLNSSQSVSGRTHSLDAIEGTIFQMPLLFNNLQMKLAFASGFIPMHECSGSQPVDLRQL